MASRDVEISNRLGLHARAAARFVHTASSFASHIQIERDGQQVDGKSILGLLLLAATQGARLRITAEGDDAEDAVSTLCTLVEDHFGERS
ncbi:MAG: HPr family phosphocarrier protein [Acidobacteria bacterium]|nr:MAG: HPr family phosphocarrier protein [Acidobacteriota bacterium]